MQESGEIDSTAAQVYRLRVIHPTDSVERLAARAGLTPQEAQDAEARLAALGLLRPSPRGGKVAVSPETAADTLLAPLEQEILQRRIAMAATRAQFHALSAEYLEARSMRSAKTSVEIVRGPDSAWAVIDDLARTCSESLDTFVPGSDGNDTAVSHPTARVLDNLQRSVRIRTLLHHPSRQQPAFVRHVSAVTAACGQVRTVNSLPARLQIYDRSCAVLPLDPQHEAAGAALIRDPTVLTFLQHLFEHYWGRGMEFGEEENRSGGPPTGPDLEVLRLMAAGKKDEVIAHLLGMSSRSVSRIVARLMERLGANSRFQAGARAALHGWLS